jgi:hypothetical protein
MRVRDVVGMLFPAGTPDWRIDAVDMREDKPAWPDDDKPGGRWRNPPSDPIDLFAIAAYLMSRSGAYHHVQPETLNETTGHPRRLVVTIRERTLWCSIGASWADAVEDFEEGGKTLIRLGCPVEIRDFWSELVDAFDEPLFQNLGAHDAPPRWWRVALALMAIADEAARDVGFLAEESLQGHPPQLLMTAVEFRLRDAMTNTAHESRGAYTISAAAPDIACILPKSRTPALGCTLRSLSHNLALLPPRGLARGCWLPPAGEYAMAGADSPLSLLLIPYPYEVPAKAFKIHGTSTTDAPDAWGWFGVEPEPEAVGENGSAKITEFVNALIDEAQKDISTVNGVVFPELALGNAAYKDLILDLGKRDGIEFVAAGLHDHDGVSGNYAAASIIPVRRAEDSERRWIEDVRQKHHRWRLDEAQITSYALGSVLDPTRNWWEKLDILSRSLTVGVLRGATTITTLICEDLARVDPAQELLRAIGPNIVIALLMDSAQLVTRWPNRYATVLAEDPGSSVLTFTSLGLIERVNATGYFTESRCVALWRDDQGVRELKLPRDAHALCITLTPVRLEEATLDGRADRRNALSWRLSGVQPVKLPPTLKPPRWLP